MTLPKTLTVVSFVNLNDFLFLSKEPGNISSHVVSVASKLFNVIDFLYLVII